MKIIGINIDGVLRDKFNQFDKLYRKKYIKNESLVSTDATLRYIALEEDINDEAESARLQSLISERITYPINTYDLKNHYKFDEKFSYENFVNDHIFELYGSAPSYPKAMDKINRFQKIGEAYNKAYEIVLISTEDDAAIQATYHFLSKNSCRIKKVIFESDINRSWDYCDLIITDNPLVIESAPENKKSVKIKWDYNQFDKSDYEFSYLAEMEDEFIINLVKENIL